MSAPILRWVLRKAPRFLFNKAARRQLEGSRIKLTLSLCSEEALKPLCLHKNGLYSLSTMFFSGTPLERLLTKVKAKNRPSRHMSNDGGNRFKRPLRLMEMPEIAWPHPLKSLRNLFFAMMIRGYYDDQFHTNTFLDGAEQVRVW